MAWSNRGQSGIDRDEGKGEDQDETDQDSKDAKPPSRRPKGKGKKRISIETKLKGLPVIRETVRIPDAVETDPEQWDLKDVSTSKRKLLRQEHSIKIAEQIKAKLDAYAVDMSIPNNDFRAAIKYTANQWPALLECLTHGHTRLDTNLLESKFRPTKIGAKNWMFIGHPEAGQKSAIIYSLLQTCTIHRINPYDYLCYVLEKLIPHDGCPPEELLKTLMPENWAKTYADRLIKERPAG